MKRLLLVFLMCPLFAFSQKVLDVVELSDGKMIVIYDDNTWAYPDELKKTTSSSQGIISTGATAAPSTNSPAKKATTKHATATTKPVSRPAAASSSVSSQCTGTTQKGARCKRMVRGGGRCYQH